MKLFAKIFWNYEEGRARALWRLAAQVLLWMIVLLILKYALFLATGLVALATQTITPAEIDVNTLRDLFSDFSGRFSDVPLGAWEIVGTLVAIWIAGRFLDRRSFADFGFRFDKDWWADFGFGLFLGGFLITLVFLLELAAGWVTITGTFVTRNPDDSFVTAILLAVVTFVFVGIGEELTSRGYQLTNLAEGLNWKRIGPRWAVVIASLLSAAVFGLLHASNPHATVLSTFSAFMGGIITALSFALTGELAIPIGLHITWNFFQGNVFGLPVSGADYTSASFVATETGGPALWVGDAFGPESGLLAISAVVLGCLLIVLWVRLRYGRVELHTAIAEPPEQG